MCERASGRLGVTAISKIISSSSKASVKGVPVFKFLSKTKIPDSSFPSLSSASEQIIPKDVVPLIFALVNFIPLTGIIVPTGAKITFCPLLTIATGTFWPAFTLGAPQTT